MNEDKIREKAERYLRNTLFVKEGNEDRVIDAVVGFFLVTDGLCEKDIKQALQIFKWMKKITSL